MTSGELLTEVEVSTESGGCPSVTRTPRSRVTGSAKLALAANWSNSINGEGQLLNFPLDDYLVAAYTVIGVAHAFVLRIAGSTRVLSNYLDASDDIAAWNEMPLQDVDWIHNVAYVRKVELMVNRYNCFPSIAFSFVFFPWPTLRSFQSGS